MAAGGLFSVQSSGFDAYRFERVAIALDHACFHCMKFVTVR
jgi:hypothetical protein